VAVAAVAVAGFAVFWTMPPRTIVMPTGTEGGAYHEVGKRYQEILAREGIRLRLVSTAGAVANLALLRNRRSGVSVALMQGGTTNENGAPEIESLGTVFYEPLWLFQRSELKGQGLDGLHGRKISIGPEGSGTRALALELLKRQGIDSQNVEFLGHSAQVAGESCCRVRSTLRSSSSPGTRRSCGSCCRTNVSSSAAFLTPTLISRCTLS
jgi:TRAP-type uncharacterized transport system substrate-binding protein